MKFNTLSISFIALFLFSTIPAQATPSFSRQIQADCRTCHFMDNKSLNKFGREFKKNAFNETREMRRERLEKSAPKSSD